MFINIFKLPTYLSNLVICQNVFEKKSEKMLTLVDICALQKRRTWFNKLY